MTVQYYQHAKNKRLYSVLEAEATVERNREEVVAVYRDVESGRVYTRPAEEFFGDVEIDGKTVKRFRPLSPMEVMFLHIKPIQTCSFCGKDRTEVKRLVAGPSCYICDECIGLCNEIMAENFTPPHRDDAPGWGMWSYMFPTWVMPRELYNEMLSKPEWSV